MLPMILTSAPKKEIRNTAVEPYSMTEYQTDTFANHFLRGCRHQDAGCNEKCCLTVEDGSIKFTKLGPLRSYEVIEMVAS